VTGDHLTFDGDCGVRPRTGNDVLTAGDPTVFCPPFPLLPLPVVLSTGVGAPRKLHGPATCGGFVHQAGPRTCIGPASIALTWNYARVLSSTSLPLAVLPLAVLPTSLAILHQVEA